MLSVYALHACNQFPERQRPEAGTYPSWLESSAALETLGRKQLCMVDSVHAGDGLMNEKRKG